MEWVEHELSGGQLKTWGALPACLNTSGKSTLKACSTSVSNRLLNLARPKLT